MYYIHLIYPSDLQDFFIGLNLGDQVLQNLFAPNLYKSLIKLFISACPINTIAAIVAASLRVALYEAVT